MKKILTLLVTTFIVHSLAGQVELYDLPEFSDQTKLKELLNTEKKANAKWLKGNPNLLKSLKLVNQRLDSVVFKTPGDGEESKIPSRKNEYIYTDKGYIQHIYQWDETNTTWVYRDKTEKEFDRFGNRTLEKSYEWSDSLNIWMIVESDSSEYDEKSRQIYYESKYWDQDENCWIGLIKQATSYDDEKLTKTSLSYDFNDESKTWVLIIKMRYQYNEDDKLIKQERFEYDIDAEGWTPDYVEEFTYLDSNNTLGNFSRWYPDSSKWIVTGKSEKTQEGNDETVLYYALDENTGEFVFSRKSEKLNFDDTLFVNALYNYDDMTEEWNCYFRLEIYHDENNNPVRSISHHIDYQTNELTPLSKKIIEYDSKNRQISAEWYSYNSTSESLVGNYRIEYTYDNNDNRTEIKEMSWNSVTNDWYSEPSDYERFTYDYDYTIDEVIMPDVEMQSYFHNLVLESIINDYYATYYYSEQEVVNISDNIRTGTARLLPNPARNQVTCGLDDNAEPAIIEIFDMHGRKVIREVIVQNRKLSVSHLHKGFYVYNIIQGDMTSKGKLLIK